MNTAAVARIKLSALMLLCSCAAIAFGTPACPQAEWTLQNPQFPANGLSAVWGSSASDIFAVGDGVILHFDGSEWRSVHHAFVYFEGVWGSSATDVFAIGVIWHDYFTSEGAIYHFDGVAWTRMPVTLPIRLRGIWGSSGSDVFVVGGEGTILHYDGASWSSMDSGTASPLSDIWGTSASDVFAVGDEGTIYHFDGETWSGMDAGTPGYIDSVWGSASDNVYGGAEGFFVVHYDGATWTRLPDYVGPYYKSFIWGSAADDVFVVGRAGGIWHYDGATWSEMPTGTSEFITGVWGTAGDNVYAVGHAGTLLHYDGSQWSQIPRPMSAGLADVWASSEADVFAVGGAVYHYDGQSWSEMDTGSLASAQDVWGSAADNVYAVGPGGIQHFDGANWYPVPTGMPSEPSLNGIWGSAANDIFVAGPAGVVLHYDGSLWSQMATGTGDPLYAVGGSSPDDVFAVGQAGLILHFDGAAWSPQVSGTGENLYDVWVNAPDDAFAVGNVTLRYDGVAWTEMDLSGAYGVWGSSAVDVFATYGGWVMHYDGADWSECSPWVGQTLTGIFGLSECELFAVGNGGTILHYGNAPPVAVLITSFRATAGEKAIELTWQIASDETVIGYRIYRTDDRDPVGHRLNDGWLIEPSARRYTDSTVRPGRRYRYTLAAVDAHGNEVRSRTAEIESHLPAMALFQNQPNPFNPTTLIRFAVAKPGRATLRVFNIEGKLIATLLDEVVEPGMQEIGWDGNDDSGRPAASGVYFCRLETGGRILSRKMILIE